MHLVKLMVQFYTVLRLVRVFSDVLVAFLYLIFDTILLVENIKIWKSHLNIREGSDYSKISHLLYADDLLVLPTAAVELQHNINKVNSGGFQSTFTKLKP